MNQGRIQYILGQIRSTSQRNAFFLLLNFAEVCALRVLVALKEEDDGSHIVSNKV